MRASGGELAYAGWDVVMYAGEGGDGDDGFIEPAVVRGYVAGGPPRKGSVHVLYSRQSAKPQFAAQAADPRTVSSTP